jgi:LPS export ABC transporter permease LptG
MRVEKQRERRNPRNQAGAHFLALNATRRMAIVTGYRRGGCCCYDFFMTILDRYVLKKFFVPFLYCFFGFIAIWLVFDLSDNGPDFIEAKAPLSFILEFYLSQIPEIVVISLPIGQLLALLYSLTQMSRSNEIISMLGAGRSVTRVLLPLFTVGLVLTGVSAFFNYEGAPRAAKTKKEMQRELTRGEKRESAIKGHLFRNRESQRTWFMRLIRPDRQTINDFQIIQQNAEGEIVTQLYGTLAIYDEATHTWTMDNVKLIRMDKNGDIIDTQFANEVKISNYSETPWRIASSIMNSDFLSVPELREYLKFNADFPADRLAPFRTNLYYRFALPWACLVVVLLAAPMGIVYSRSGILGGVATAITLFFLLVFSMSLSLAFGKGGAISPVVAAWLPLGVFFCIGLVLLWFRSTSRDLPSLKIFG